MKFQQATDEELLAYYRSDGNSEWLGYLLQRYTTILLGVCLKYLKDEELAKDGVQHIFMKIITELEKQYQIDNFGGWLYRISVNYCLTQLREKKPLHNDYSIANYSDEEFHDEKWHWEQLKQSSNLNDELEKLKKEQRECIIMFFYEELSYKQIADKTGLTFKEIKSHIQNGKRNLKLRLENLKD